MGMKTFVSGSMNHYKMIIEILEGNQIKTAEVKFFNSRREMFDYAHSIKDKGYYKIVMSGVETEHCIWLDEAVIT